ncbi:MAG: hypothetical protein Kow006_00520 [Gammaproteobacteria bacterium]
MIRSANWIGRRLGTWLSHPTHYHSTSTPTDPQLLRAALQPGDVLLVEGNTRVSIAIKYLTQSTWSHAALYVGEQPQRGAAEGSPLCFVEADIVEGVRLVGFDEFEGLHTRICRPVGLTAADRRSLIDHACSRIGQQYDLKNVLDLARYLVPTPPVPVRWRRRMLAFGSGDPTRAICSTLIAQCFQSIRYPILPHVERQPTGEFGCPECMREIFRVRHHSLFVPRDFDASPYFEVVKPTLVTGFDYRKLDWSS